MTELAVPFTRGFYTDGSSAPSSTSDVVPGLFPVAVGGHPYQLDVKSAQWAHQSIDTLRPVFIQGDSLGEKQINPESLWRASQNSWHKGAGQRHADRPESDTARFWASKGVDVWTKWQMSLLPDTQQTRASANTNLKLSPAGSRLYVGDGNALVYTTDLSAYTAVTGTPASAVTSVASDGFTVYAGFAANGLWTTNRGTGVATQLVTGTPTVSNVSYVRGRVMFTVGRSIYNQTTLTPGALGTALFDHPNTDFQWVGFAEGVGFIYAAGFSGDKSLIYRIGIQPDGTALSVPIQAGQLPDGEIVTAIVGYLGFILIGTSKGVRLAEAAANGDLQVGALLTTAACRCFEGQDRYVWFGWDNYDAGSTGLGRLDLTIVNDGGAPGYASDLMVTGQGQVSDVTTFLDQRVFAVSGLGFYIESVNLVPSGTLDSGLITYDLPDQKVALYVDVKHDDPLYGTHEALISTDQGSFLSIGVHSASSGEYVFSVPEYRGETFELREHLTRDAVTTLGPTVTRHTLLANPAVDAGYYLIVPILLAELLDNGQAVDVAAELAFLKGLHDLSQRTTYQEGSTTYSVTVEGLEWHPTHLTLDNKAANGTCLLKMKTI